MLLAETNLDSLLTSETLTDAYEAVGIVAKAKPALKDLSNKISARFEVIVECPDELAQQAIYEELVQKGNSCRLVTF